MSKKEKIEMIMVDENNPTDTFCGIDSATKTTNQSLNVWQKLVAVRKTIGYIKKGAQGYGYKYAKESDVLLAMAEEMNNQGLVLEQVPVTCENVPVNFKGKEVAGLRIHFQYIITDSDNPSDQIIRSQFMQQPGCDAQVIGSMMTYGMKYFLFKTFNIAMDEYDIDAMDKSKEEHAAVIPKISASQVNILKQLLEKAEVGNKFFSWIETKFGVSVIEDLRLNHLDEVVASLNMAIDRVEKSKENQHASN